MKTNDRVHPAAVRNRPRAWRRFWARMIDTLLGAFVVALLLEILFPEVARYFHQDGQSFQGLFALAAIIPLEALCLSLSGTTPGKRLLGLRIERTGGAITDFPQALQRALGVWVKGLGFGIPLVTLFTMAHAKGVLEREGQTSWDRQNETRVICVLDRAETEISV